MAEKRREEACLEQRTHRDTKNSTPLGAKRSGLLGARTPNEETPDLSKNQTNGTESKRTTKLNQPGSNNKIGRNASSGKKRL